MTKEGSRIIFIYVTIYLIICASATQKAAGSSKSGSNSMGRFISFDSSSGKIDLNFDLSVPFLSIPLNEKDDQGGPPLPFLNVNTKAVTVFGLLSALSVFVIPLFIKKLPEPISNPANLHHPFRTDRGLDLSLFGDSINEILFRNNRVTPCIQRIVCSIVAAASDADQPNSVDKIIDGFSSHQWFEQAVNGTIIQGAVESGRLAQGSDKCTKTYLGCALNSQIVSNLIKIIGV